MEGERPNREHEEQSLITSTTRRSWVWNHFTFDENTKKAQCNYCQSFIAISKGSTRDVPCALCIALCDAHNAHNAHNVKYRFLIIKFFNVRVTRHLPILES